MKNRKKFFTIVGIGLGILGVFISLYIFRISTKQLCFENYCFFVEIADTPLKRVKGLMYQTSLKDNQGMLFVFEKPGIYGFWMKNTLIPLDIVWLDENFQVVNIKENAQPCLKENCPIFKNSTPAKYVLEIKAGKVQELKIKEGGRFTLFK